MAGLTPLRFLFESQLYHSCSYLVLILTLLTLGGKKTTSKKQCSALDWTYLELVSVHITDAFKQLTVMLVHWENSAHGSFSLGLSSLECMADIS